MAIKKEMEISHSELEIGLERFTACILGTSPIILHRKSLAVMKELAAPKGKKTSVEKAGSMKHNPLLEFQRSPYINEEENGKTYLQCLSVWFKKGMESAALDLPGFKKSEIGRRIYAEGNRVDLYGIPELFMTPVTIGGFNGSSDISTRAIVPHWAVMVSVSFPKHALNGKTVATLLAAAGLMSGAGDYRIQKGGSYGQYKLVDPSDPEFLQILKMGARSAQKSAMENPSFYDNESQELYEFVESETKRRGFNIV